MRITLHRYRYNQSWDAPPGLLQDILLHLASIPMSPIRFSFPDGSFNGYAGVSAVRLDVAIWIDIHVYANMIRRRTRDAHGEIHEVFYVDSNRFLERLLLTSGKEVIGEEVVARIMEST